MQLVIAEQANTPTYISTYVIIAEFMHGDADSYSTREWASPRQDAIKQAVRALQETPRRGDVPKWYYDAMQYMWDNAAQHGVDADEGLYLIDPENGEGIPRDNPYCDTKAAMESFNVFYYDDQGNEYSVEVTPTT